MARKLTHSLPAPSSFLHRAFYYYYSCSCHTDDNPAFEPLPPVPPFPSFILLVVPVCECVCVYIENPSPLSAAVHCAYSSPPTFPITKLDV